MNAAIPRIVIFCAFIAISVTVAGCVIWPGPASPTSTVTPSPIATTPIPDGTFENSFVTIIPVGSYTPTWKPETNSTHVSPTPRPIVSATTSDWGSDKGTYNRGDTATGWVYVTNTGNVPIDEVSFKFVIKRTVYFVPVEKIFYYNASSLGIQPGARQKVEYSQTIPAEFSGISTAGDYQLTVTAFLAGNEIGSETRSIKVV